MLRSTLLGVLLLAGCGEEQQPVGFVAYPIPSYEVRTRIEPAAPPDHHDSEGGTVDLARARHVLLLQGRRLERPAEVVGVVDAHEPGGREDVAFQRLQERAAALGADAVVGIDFHHGEGAGEPLHLSGLAVRFLDHAP